MENHFAELYERELTKLKDEFVKFNDEANIWKVTAGVTNPAGVLVKHLLGNLNFTIGATLGQNGYVRNREYEFTISSESKNEIITQIESTIEVVKNVLKDLDQAKLDEPYALEMVGKKSTAFYLTFFFGHFTYHVGQINYLRRILEA